MALLSIVDPSTPATAVWCSVGSHWRLSTIASSSWRISSPISGEEGHAMPRTHRRTKGRRFVLPVFLVLVTNSDDSERDVNLSRELR